MRQGLVFLFGVLFLFSSWAQAQEKGFVLGEVGLTFTESTNGLFGAEVGVSITPNLQVVGTVEYMADVLSDSLAEFLETASRVMDVQIDGELPTTYAGAGIRFHVMVRGNVHPYIQLDGGVGKTDPQLTIIRDGEDITSQVPEASELDATNGALAISAGVRADLGERVTSEFAFKWLNVFTEETLKVNRFHFGIGVHF